MLSLAKEKPAGPDRPRMRATAVKVLVPDVGGRHMKLPVTGESEPRKLASEPMPRLSL